MNTSRHALFTLAILATLFASATNASAQVRIEMNSPAAIVNGEIITKAQVEAVVKYINGGERPPTPTRPTDSQMISRRQMAVAVLIDDALWRQAVAKQVPPPSQTEITKRMVTLEDGLKKQGKTMQQFCDETAQTLAQVQNAMTFVLQWADFVAAKATDESLSAYYVELKDYYDGTQVDVSHILVRINPGATDAERQRALAKINSIRQQIQSGGIDFAKAAESYSECDTKNNGGHIGLIPRKWGWFDETFTRAAFDPALQPGALVGPLLTESGYHLIRLNDRKPGMVSSFDKAKEQVKNDFQEDLRQKMIADQRKLSKVEIYRNVVEAAP